MLDDMVLFFTVWINFCSAFWAHPMYVSMTNMDIDSQKGDVVLSIRIFIHDVETILHNKYNIHSWIGTSSEHSDSRRLLGEYIHERFSIAVNNGKKLDLQTDSITIVEESMWFYMKGTAQQTIRRVEIENRLLTDFFAKQKNLVIINNKIGRELNRKTPKIELSL